MPLLINIPERFHQFLLASVGLLSVIVYAGGIAARYPLRSGLTDTNTIWSSIAGRGMEAFSFHVLLYLVLTLLYLGALSLIGHTSNKRQIIIIIVSIWLLASLALLGTAPAGESHDIFDYIYRGRMLGLEHMSPLAITPDDVPSRLFYAYISWGGSVDTYGPLWEYASAATAYATNVVLNTIGLQVTNASTCGVSPSMCMALAISIIGYRLLAIALTGFSGLLIAILVRHHSPKLVPSTLLIWFWNPLLLLSTALGAHNDALMLPILLAALLAMQRQRWMWALLALALAAHVKLTALLFVPPIIVWLIWQVGWWGTIWRCVVALAITIPLSWGLYWPLGGWATLPRMLHERSLYMANSVARIGYVSLQDVAGWPQLAALRMATNVANTIFVIVAALVVLRILDAPGLLWRRHTTMRPINDSMLWTSICAIVLAYLLIGSFWFQPWYLVWLLAPAALLPYRQLARVLLPWYSFGALCSSLISDFFFYEMRTTWTRTNQTSLVVATMLIPLMLAGLFSIWQQRRKRIAITPDQPNGEVQNN